MARRKEAPLSEIVQQLVKAMTPTLEDVSERSEIGYSTLRDWSRRPRRPRSESLARLEDAAVQQRDELDRLLRDLRAARPRSEAEG